MNISKAFAIAAHPDDIEFMMAGTLIRLGQVGYELHYMNIANGSCGSATLSRDEIVATRAAEAQAAARLIGATWHSPITDDLMVYYTPQLVARVAAVMREVQPEILLLPSPQDYMEDHINACRRGVTAAFCRGIKNFATDPPMPVTMPPMAVYHALPYGLCDPLRQPVASHFFVDIAPVLGLKRDMLACHASQKQWLDDSQGIDSYLQTMEDMMAEIGRQSGTFAYAEGWRRHSHLGFASVEFDPLSQALASAIVESGR